LKKKLSKCYPQFRSVKFVVANKGNNWCSAEELPPIPARFGKVIQAKSVGAEEENFISFACSIDFPDDTRHTNQDGMFMYNEPIELTHGDQLRGNLQNGDVDFFINWKCLSLENGGNLIDVHTGTGIRYPYRIATYYPIRNVLMIKDLVFKTPTPSLKKLLAWIFQKVETVGYKYNKGSALLIGCDPEFNITDIMDERVSAERIFPDPNRRNPIGTDGSSSTGELRPSPADCPLKLTDNMKRLMNDLAKKLGNDKKILTGGGGNIAPTGHHIHFNKMLSSEEIELLDDFVGYPSLQIKGAKRPSSSYEVTGRRAVRRQPHGCEYRTPASSLIPELAAALHTTAYCCVMKWESLGEGESFEFDKDDDTTIPALSAYRALDVTPDKRYTPHLEEFWKWVTKKDGREIDPKRDCLFRWVEGRKEVKPYPGIKVNWASNVFPTVTKEKFIEVETFDKIYDLSVFVLPTPEEEEDFILQICLPAEEKREINIEKLFKLKEKYNIVSILGFDHASKKIGLSQTLLNNIRTMKKLRKMIVDFAKVICI